ncbi:hypothetical protein [Blastococcus sp. KM273129]|uniref:hypothetical protein n=1 Tax=Blastococcus sp. KM273129 TaxID=2570315 RepID=UPI001F15D5E5|nr:hypothetical protein [Blastococcus sp. KM273129]MCF6735148.1 hypothetical protein [Blastococcus sp. KM273129]
MDEGVPLPVVLEAVPSLGLAVASAAAAPAAIVDRSHTAPNSHRVIASRRVQGRPACAAALCAIIES